MVADAADAAAVGGPKYAHHIIIPTYDTSFSSHSRTYFNSFIIHTRIHKNIIFYTRAIAVYGYMLHIILNTARVRG